MKRRTFITTVITTNVLFILLVVHKHNKVTELLYKKQHLEKELQMCIKQEQSLHQELCDLQNRSTVKAYAAKYLHMSPVTLKQMRKLSTHA